MLKNIDSNFELRPFTDDDYPGIVTLKNALFPNHPSTVEQMRHNDNSHLGKIQQKRWVFEQNGNIVVSSIYTQFFEAYHPKKFVISIYVLPDLQGKGYGAFSYNYLIEKLEPFNPIKITSEVNEIHVRSIRFLEDRGFRNTMKEQESKLDLTAYDPLKYQSEIDRVLDQGLRIVTLTEFRKEDERADYKCWGLEREVAPDMPWTDPISIPEYDHYQEFVLKSPKFNPDSWFIILDKTMVVGLNNLWKTPQETIISTGLTGVLRKYRRKGIATALKHTCLIWAKNQDYKFIRTNNADTNEGMLSINLRVGFKFMPAWLVFDKILCDDK